MNQFMIKNNKQTIYAIYVIYHTNVLIELIAKNRLEVAIYLVIPFGKIQSLG